MKLDDLLIQTSEWLKGTGADSDVVISSRIRLARNLYKVPFSHWASDDQKNQILNIVTPAILKSKIMKDNLSYTMDKLDDVDRQLLIERHLVSKEHTKKEPSRAVIIKNDETVSIMINEEDHLRIQAIKSGFNLDGAWDIVSTLDNDIGRNLDYAFSDDWGYLTACPTNTGTGMRASVMLHLPGLVMANQINKILQAITKLSLTVRGFYGEGSEASGNFFQISNQVTLGNSEDEIIDNLKRVIKQVVDQERQIRSRQLNSRTQGLEDNIWRAYGILSNAKIISSQEAISLLSSLRLGVDLGIVNNIDKKIVNELFIIIQPSHVQKISGKKLTPQQRDEKRAELLRNKLNK